MTSELQSFLIFIGVVTSIAGIAGATTLYGRHSAQRRLESMRRRYTEHTTGTITEIARPQNPNRPTILTVSYEVAGQSYTLQEHMRYTAPGTHTGGFFITVKKEPALGEVEVGNDVRIVYQPDAPRYAMLADNEGIMEL